MFKIIEANYDKLLHALLTFALMMFGMLWLSWKTAALIVLFLQIVKWVRNYTVQDGWIKFRHWALWHESWGDWIANLSGYGLVALYLTCKGAEIC